MHAIQAYEAMFERLKKSGKYFEPKTISRGGFVPQNDHDALIVIMLSNFHSTHLLQCDNMICFNDIETRVIYLSDEFVEANRVQMHVRDWMRRVDEPSRIKLIEEYFSADISHVTEHREIPALRNWYGYPENKPSTNKQEAA